MATSSVSKATTTATSVISEIATVAAGCTISEAQYAQNGKTGYLRLVIKSSTAIADGSSKTVATVVAQKKPAFSTYGISNNSFPTNKATIYSSSGEVVITGPVNANTNIAFTFMYLLN